MKSIPSLLSGLLLSSFGLVGFLPAQGGSETMPVDNTAGIAILSGGRIKPLQTYAEESLRSISGKNRIDGLSPLQVLWGFHFDAESYRGRAWIRMDSQELKGLCGFSPAQRRFSFNELMASQGLKKVVETATKQRSEEHELTSTENDALAVYSKMERVAGFIDGSALTIVPRTKEGGSWSSPQDLRTSKDPSAQAVLHSFQGLSVAWKKGDASAFSIDSSDLGASGAEGRPRA